VVASFIAHTKLLNVEPG